jgi:hypothetical protein
MQSHLATAYSALLVISANQHFVAIHCTGYLAHLLFATTCTIESTTMLPDLISVLMHAIDIYMYMQGITGTAFLAGDHGAVHTVPVLSLTSVNLQG